MYIFIDCIGNYAITYIHVIIHFSIDLFKRYIFGNFTDEEELNLFPSEIELLFPG